MAKCKALTESAVKGLNSTNSYTFSSQNRTWCDFGLAMHLWYTHNCNPCRFRPASLAPTPQLRNCTWQWPDTKAPVKQPNGQLVNVTFQF